MADESAVVMSDYLLIDSSHRCFVITSIDNLYLSFQNTNTCTCITDYNLYLSFQNANTCITDNNLYISFQNANIRITDLYYWFE